MTLSKRRHIAWFLTFALALNASNSSRAADWAYGPPPPRYVDSPGIPCSVGAPRAPPAATAEDLPWASVWLGHFSGGRPFEDDNRKTVIDWRDDKLCFPSRQKCQAWIAGLRGAYRRPEGFWTCLLLR